MSPVVAPRSCLDLFAQLRWLGGVPLMSVIEPYRQREFIRFFDERDADGFPKKNLGLFGRGKKNWKSADLVLVANAALFEETDGYKECFIVAFDEDQSRTDLDLCKKLIQWNPATLGKRLVIQQNRVSRKDGRGYIKILPGQSALGEHGRTFRFLGIDEIHTQRDWDLLESLQPDPTRRDAQTWITSYASLFHKPGVPLYDLMQMGRSGADPKMLFSWYAADYCTDEALKDATPEQRANPSMASWPVTVPAYLEQQQRRLPAHKYRRLHLNLPGLPAGSAFTVDSIITHVDRGVKTRRPEPGLTYVGFVDMSGGSNDDAVLAIGHLDGKGRAVLDRCDNQGPPPPFNPRLAVERFVAILREYAIAAVVGDAYAGETFRREFEAQGVSYRVSQKTRSQLYESLEPSLNTHRVVLLDVGELETQLLGLIWRGSKIDHPGGEHDDYANGCAGCVDLLLARGRQCRYCADPDCSGWHLLPMLRSEKSQDTAPPHAITAQMVEQAGGLWGGSSQRMDTEIRASLERITRRD